MDAPFNEDFTPINSAEIIESPEQAFDSDVSEEVTDSPLIEELSVEFIGSWNFLVSRTNWEKGKVIHNWRTKLSEAGVVHGSYTDESWSRRVGNVSPQHVGRLRRVYERFGETREQYVNLYWSHFQAALDWEDAEMWLEGAVQNQWSVATMRIKRWETLGSPPDKKPKDSDIIMSELDEDVNPRNDSDYETETQLSPIGPAGKTNSDDDDDEDKRKKYRERQDYITDHDGLSTGELLSNLKRLQELPDDLREAFEQLKIAILSHKLTEWSDTDQNQVLMFLDAMKAMVVSAEEVKSV